ncbi:MAG TPA: TauD/TfdA family dioxygenase [Stellaceae bacterium]|nr:TauD/TfdA family dioxygenase [Stellaceae bacterium]
MTYDYIRVEPLSTALGAEISGVDLAKPPAEPVLAEIRHAFGEHGVIFFRDQQLTPEQHLAFAQRFGGIDINRFFAAMPGYPMIAEVRKEPEQRRNIGNGWHTDHSYDLKPARARCSMPARCRRPAATRCSPACMPPMRRFQRG